MELYITVLGSGSSGNSVLISYNNYGVLIDAGFSRKETLNRMTLAGINHDLVKSIFVTHEHTDHIKGLRVLGEHLDATTYATSDVLSLLKERNLINKKTKTFQAGTKFNLYDFLIRPFSVPHDATDPVCFTFNIGEVKIGYAMDLGHLNNVAISALHDSNVLLIECNHDLTMLRNSERPISLKQRIAGKHGHLNNIEAIESFSVLITKKTHHIMLGHISNECNNHEIIMELATKKLKSMNREDIKLSLMHQNRPSSPILVG